MMRFCLSATVVVSTLIFGGAAIANDAIALGLRMPRAGPVGDALPLTIVFRNVGEESLFVPFSGVDYGAESLVVCARRDGQWHSTGQIHFDRETGAARFDFVPLRQGQTFATPILSINNSAPMPALRLPEVGTYEVFVTYASNGPGVVGVLWPVWRGVVMSPIETVTLSSPAKEEVARRLTILRECAVTGDGCDAAAVEYFVIVRNSAAATILAGLLDEASSPDQTLIEAVANQLGETADDALQRFVKRFPDQAVLVRELREPDDNAALCADRYAGATRAN